MSRWSKKGIGFVQLQSVYQENTGRKGGLIDQNHHATSKVMKFDIWAQIPPQDAKGFQTSHQTHLKVKYNFFVPFGPPCWKNVKFHSITFSCVW